MAGRSEKKRSVREKSLGFYYTVGAVLCLIAWFTRHVVLPKGGVKLSTRTLIWRSIAVIVPYGYSLFSIQSSLKLGLSFSLSNDIYFVATLVCLLSLAFDWAYYLLLIIPFYGVFKVVKFLLDWVQTADQEPDVPTNRERKVKRKLKIIR